MRKIITDPTTIKKKLNWIWEQINNEAAPNVVERILPKSYDRYFKLFFSVLYKNENSSDATTITTYKELAELTELNYDSSFCFMSLPSMVKYSLDSEKDKDEIIITKLVEILGSDTTCIFHRFGDDFVPEQFFEEWIYIAKLSELPSLIEELNSSTGLEGFDHLPLYVFPEDKSWILSGTLIFQSYTLLLCCNNSLASKIEHQKIFEYIEIQPNDPYFDFKRRKK